jgi:AraC-like DNA-binding protein
MQLPAVSTRPCYSLRLVRPFLRLLAQHPSVPPGLLDPLAAMDLDARLPVNTVHELLRGAVALTGDPDIGLKAARAFEPGEFGALEYAAFSADTVARAVEVIGRYLKLVNDAVDFQLRTQGALAVVELHNSVVMPRAAEAFEAAAFYVAVRMRCGTELLPGRSVSFTHEAPQDTREYERTFDTLQVRFGQPCAGFTFDAAALEKPMPAGDHQLHEILLRHVDHALAQLPKAESLVARVRELIVAELPTGKTDASWIAKRLHMSGRTLARRLEDEGATFRQLQNDVRKQLALRYASTTDLQLSEIALLLGFSSATVFHRSFKRWTGMTPVEYRQSHRGK